MYLQIGDLHVQLLVLAEQQVHTPSQALVTLTLQMATSGSNMAHSALGCQMPDANCNVARNLLAELVTPRCSG